MAGGAAVWCWCDVLPVCCCPVLYSYVGRGGVRSPTGAGIIGPARGGGGVLPVQRPAAAGAIFTSAAGPGCDPRKSRPRKTPHGKRPTENAPRKTGNKKRGKRGAGRVYLFFCVKFSGGWNHPPPVLLSSTSGGWNPSRAIRSRVAVRIYPATLSPELVAAAVKFSSSSFGIRIDFVMNFDK